jgi:hypothetical protein
MTRTDPAVVAGQAMAIAYAWSPPDAPQSWWLTSATFAAIAREGVLLELAAEIPPDRLPPLLLAAVLEYLVGAEPDAPIARHYPVPGREQPPPDPAFGAELAAFGPRGGTASRNCARRTAKIGRERDLDWVSVDPLVPLGPDAQGTVQHLDVPRARSTAGARRQRVARPRPRPNGGGAASGQDHEDGQGPGGARRAGGIGPVIRTIAATTVMAD